MSGSPQRAVGYENSQMKRASPITRPMISDQKAPASVQRGHSTASTKMPARVHSATECFVSCGDANRCSVFSVHVKLFTVEQFDRREVRTGERRDRVGQDRHDVSEQVVEVEDDRQPAHAHRHQHQHKQPVDKTRLQTIPLLVQMHSALSFELEHFEHILYLNVHTPCVCAALECVL